MGGFGFTDGYWVVDDDHPKSVHLILGCLNWITKIFKQSEKPSFQSINPSFGYA
jgi:hypothetical protein